MSLRAYESGGDHFDALCSRVARLIQIVVLGGIAAMLCLWLASTIAVREIDSWTANHIMKQK